MSLTNHADVALVGTEDMATCFEVVSKSFGHDAPFMDIYFPNHDTPSGQLQGSNRLTAWRRSTENSVFLKAVTSIEGDPANKQRIMGFAIWTHMKDIPPQKLENAENVEEIWPDVNDRKFMAAMWEEYVKPRTQAVRDSHGKGVYVLELLAVHPDYQRLGAGRALVTWGIEASDSLRVRAVIEATPAGKPLYEKCGFRAEIEEMRFDLGEEFSARAKPKLAFMVREPNIVN